MALEQHAKDEWLLNGNHAACRALISATYTWGGGREYYTSSFECMTFTTRPTTAALCKN